MKCNFNFYWRSYKQVKSYKHGRLSIWGLKRWNLTKISLHDRLCQWVIFISTLSFKKGWPMPYFCLNLWEFQLFINSFVIRSTSVGPWAEMHVYVNMQSFRSRIVSDLFGLVEKSRIWWDTQVFMMLTQRRLDWFSQNTIKTWLTHSRKRKSKKLL